MPPPRRGRRLLHWNTLGFGMVMGNLGCVTHGAAMIYPAESFEPAAVLETVQEERCTALYGVPTMFIAELAHPDFARYDLSSLRTGVMAGSPCPMEVMRQVIDRMHMREVEICYGMTETSPLTLPTPEGGGCSGDARPSGPRWRLTGLPGPTARGAPSEAAAITEPCTQRRAHNGETALSPCLQAGACAPTEKVSFNVTAGIVPSGRRGPALRESGRSEARHCWGRRGLHPGRRWQ